MKSSHGSLPIATAVATLGKPEKDDRTNEHRVENTKLLEDCIDEIVLGYRSP